MVTSLWDKKSMKAFVFMFSVFVSLSFYLWGVTLTDNYFWIYSCKEAQEMVMCLLSLLGMVLSFWLYSAVTTYLDLGNESPDSSHPLFRFVERE